MIENSKSLFIATPISAFDNDEEYVEFRDWLKLLLKQMEEKYYSGKIYSAATEVKSQNSLDDPIEAIQIDLSNLDSVSDFMLIYPKKMATSALIELGYALAKEKNITIIHPENVPLPFIASKLDCVFNDVTIISVGRFDQTSIEKISNELF